MSNIIIIPGRPGRPIVIDRGGRIPGGGIEGQSLVKSSDLDYATEWATVTGAPGYATRAGLVSANTATPGLGLSDGQIVRAAGLEYRRLAASSAISDLLGWVPNGDAAPGHFGAVGDGATDDAAAFTAADTYGGNLEVDGHFELTTPVTLTTSAPDLSRSETWSDLTDGGSLDWTYGLFRDEGFLPVNRYPGRSFFGEAARHSANRLGANGYGDDAISGSIASWMVKNAQVAAMSPDTGGRIGLTGAAWIQAGAAGSIGAGILGVARNDGISGSARGGYFEVIAAKTAGFTSADIAAEFQVGNRTGQVPVASAYDMANSIVNGMQIAVESQEGYTLGDADTPYAAATQPAGAAIDMSGGSLGAAYQKWTAGIVFRNGALVRDGSSFASALVMAQKHQLKWEVSASVEGASVWSEVTAGASRMAQAFRNNEVTFYGPTGQTVAAIRHDSAGGATVNNPVLRASRAGIAVAMLAEGSDTNIPVEVQTKGTGVTRMTSHGGSGEHLRLLNTNAATDYMTILGSVAGQNVTIGAAGASTNINIALTPKGTGRVRFGTHTASADVAVTGYIEILDAGGTVRRLAVVA